MCCLTVLCSTAGQVFSHHMVCGCGSLSYTLPRCPSCCHGAVLNGITLHRWAFRARFNRSLSLVGLRQNSEANRREIPQNSAAPICRGTCGGCVSRHSDAWSGTKEVVMLIMVCRNDDELPAGCSGCHGRTWTVGVAYNVSRSRGRLLHTQTSHWVITLSEALPAWSGFELVLQKRYAPVFP